LFWTAVLDPDNVKFDLAAGTATLEASDLHLTDYHDFENALLRNGSPPSPGVVSFKVQWRATGAVNHFNNSGQKFRGDFRNATAQMEWSGRSGDFEYTSQAIGTSGSVFAELGQESNGSFY
jgi:hypothetical protein